MKAHLDTDTKYFTRAIVADKTTTKEMKNHSLFVNRKFTQLAFILFEFKVTQLACHFSRDEFERHLLYDEKIQDYYIH